MIGFHDKDWQLWQAGMSRIQSTPDLEQTLHDLVRLATEAGGADSGSLYLVDEARGVLIASVLYNLPKEYVKGCGEVRIGDQCCGRAVESKRPWVVEDMFTDPLFATAKQAAKKSGIRAAFSVPVVDAYNRCIGSLACHYRKRYAPTNYEIERNHLFATLVAFALSSEAGSATKKSPVPVGRKARRTRRASSPISAD